MTTPTGKLIAQITAAIQTVVAFSYIRFSTRKQATGDSYRRQSELAETYCRRRGWMLSDKTFEDLGVSAWRGKNALVGNLGEFLKAVQSGAVPSGSALIVESLDRITRQGIDEGYDVIKKILKAGIILVTLTPEREFDVSATRSLTKGALEIQLILERAAEESERKSERIQAAWASKRQRAREGKEQLPRKSDGRVTHAITNILPAWVEDRDGKLQLIPARAKVVKRLFELAAAGYGRSKIVQALKAEGIPSFTGKAEWASPTIAQILRDRRALGEYQPKKKAGNIPDGPPLMGYYPAVVTEQEWLAARAGLIQRRRSLGGSMKDKRWTPEEDALVRDLELTVAVVARRIGRTRAAVHQRRHALGLTKKQERASDGNFINIFSGLVYHAREPHDTYIVATRLDANGPTKALLNRDQAEGKARSYLFPLPVFEKAVLNELRELKSSDVFPPSDADTGFDEAGELKSELDGIEVELAEADAFMRVNGFSPTIGKRITELERRKKELETQLVDARARTAVPVDQAWSDYRSLVDLLEKAPDERDARTRMRAALRRIVDSIWLLVVGRGWIRIAVVQVYFKGGARRSYLIVHQAVRSNGRALQEGFTFVQSWAQSPTDGIGLECEPDLRNPADVARLEAGLLKLPREELARYAEAARTVEALNIEETTPMVRKRRRIG
jgi:DNA invertase Pin-like site-specific DNA recombinase